MSHSEEVLTERQTRSGPGWKHLYRKPSRAKSRDRPYSNLKWSAEAEGAASRMATREVIGDAEMIRIMQEIEPNRVWTISAIRGKIFRIRNYVRKT